MKNKKKKVLLVILSFVAFLGIVSAASKYYNYRWSNKDVEMVYWDSYITNDVLKVDNGFIATGFYADEYAVIKSFDDNGKTVKELVLDEESTMAKRVYEVDDGYLVVGIRGDILSVFLVDKDLNNYEYSSLSTEYFDWEDEIYFEEDEKFIYVISDSYDDSIIKIKKDFGSGIDIIEVVNDEYTDDIQKMVDKYVNIGNYYDYNEEDFYPTFVSDFGDGYIYGLNSFYSNRSMLVYINKENKEEWMKIYNNTFIRDGIEHKGNFIFIMSDISESVVGVDADITIEGSSETSESECSSYLVIIDKDANILEKENINNYYDDVDYFWGEHLINLNESGFVLTGSEVNETSSNIPMMGGIEKADSSQKRQWGEKKNDGNEPPKKPIDEPISMKDALLSSPPPFESKGVVLYFSTIHNIETKTDGNGKIEATKVNANFGDEIRFTITPNPGFILSEVKVTDSKGNVLTFTDNTFTMPNADVTIEATFIVENPETVAFISIILFIVLAISATIIYRNKKKLENIN